MTNNRLMAGLLASACFMAMTPAALAEVKFGADDIGGVVKSAKGPEAGVWVVAETKDLQTPYVKIVVTDDQGQYVLPDLPKAKYKIWVRGYGLVDSKPVDGTVGKPLNLAAVAAPTGLAAAQYYPAEYWLSMANVPKGDLSGDEVMLTIKECLQCHQIGDKATREFPAGFDHLGTFKTSLDKWDRRTRSGPAGGMMSGMFQSLGDQRALFADWADRVAKGEYPKVAPPRPQGVERNVVITEWDWSNQTTYSHDAAASDVRDPTVNANGLVYGPGQYDDAIAWVNPVTNETGEIKIASTGTKGGFGSKDGAMFAPSPYWGEEKIWFSAAQPRSSAVDHKGRAWVAAKAKDGQADYCKAGSSNKFAQYSPIEKSGKGLAFYDPTTKKVETIETCLTADHNQFASTKVVPGNTVFFGNNDYINWVSADIWDKTHNAEMAQGWLPTVLDTNGDGKVTKGWSEFNDKPDPTKDRHVHSTCYSIGVSPADGSVWCSGVGPGTRKLTRYFLGSNPPETSFAEQYEPPAEMLGMTIVAEGGVDVDSEGVVWQNWRGTDHVTAFDRRKCKVINGPTATGKHCPEGWTAYRQQGPHIGGTNLNANFLYLSDVDRHGVLGLGENVSLQQPTNSDGILVLQPKTNSWVKLHIPYPMGFLTRAINGRIDDEKAGWKGRGLWTAYANLGIWHIEGGKGQKPKLVKIQLRPDPLAN